MKAWIQYKHVIMYINYISRLRTSPTDICASAAASTLRKRLQLGLPVPDRGEHQPKDFRRNDDRDLATRTPSVGKMAIPTTKLFNCIAMCGCALPLKARGDIFSVTLPCIARDLRKGNGEFGVWSEFIENISTVFSFMVTTRWYWSASASFYLVWRAKFWIQLYRPDDRWISSLVKSLWLYIDNNCLVGQVCRRKNSWCAETHYARGRGRDNQWVFS